MFGEKADTVSMAIHIRQVEISKSGKKLCSQFIISQHDEKLAWYLNLARWEVESDNVFRGFV